MFEAHRYAPLFLALLAVVFIAVVSYMFLYGKRSRDRQNKIEGNRPPASKEAGILEAQEAMRQERRQHHRH